MNDNDIKTCIKNGYCWSSCGDKPETTPTRDYTHEQLGTFEGLHATQSAAQAAIAARNRLARLAEYLKSIEPITPKPVGETQPKEVVADEPQPKILNGDESSARYCSELRHRLTLKIVFGLRDPEFTGDSFSVLRNLYHALDDIEQVLSK